MSALLRLYARCFGYPEIRTQLALAAALTLGLGQTAPSPLAALAWTALGATLWILFEYVLHRWVLHAPRVRAKHPRLRRAHDGMHRVHHLAPTDLDLLFISHKGSVALALLSASAGFILGRAPGALGVALGFTLAMIQYGVAHLAAHTDYAPLTRWGARMKRAHLLHHDRDNRRCFGVLTPLPDLLAGTWISDS